MCLLLCCGAFLAQIILFVLNFLLSIFSLAVTGIGVYLLMEAKKINDGDLGFVSETPIIVVAAGCIFSAIFFCGCCGAFCRNRCLLIVYAALTIVLATATVVFTVLIFQGTDELKESAKGVLTDTFSDPQNKETFGMIEAALGCCGTTGPEYYNSSVPMTCCRSALQNLQNLQQGVQQGVQLDSDSIASITNITSGDSISLSCPVSEAYEKGCVAVVIDFLSQIFDIAGKVLICIIVIEIFSLAVTGIGVYLLMEAKKINDGDLGFVSETPIIVVAAGCIFSAIFFCGCCGAFCRNRCLLIVYAALTIVLATATVVFTVLIFQGTDELKESAKGVLTDTFSDPQNKETFGMIEAALGCCGTTGPEYYNSSVPMTCCRSALQNLQNLQQGVQQGVQLDSDSIASITNITSGDSISLSCPVSEAYEKGCVAVVIDFLSQIFDIAGKVLICIIVIEYVAAFLAIFLTCYIGK